MEPMVEARVMHLVGPVASTSPRVNCRAQGKASDRATCSGPFKNHMEEEYGYRQHF